MLRLHKIDCSHSNVQRYQTKFVVFANKNFSKTMVVAGNCSKFDEANLHYAICLFKSINNQVLDVHQNFFAIIGQVMTYLINIPLQRKQQVLYMFMIRECMYCSQWSIGIHEILILAVMNVCFVSILCDTIYFGAKNDIKVINTLTGLVQFDTIVICIQRRSISINHTCLDTNIELQARNDHVQSKFNPNTNMAIHTNPSYVTTNK